MARSKPVPPGPPPQPAVQRLRVRFAKRGRLRFASHRDVARAIERAVRRSGLPVAYSGGFNPHPKLSYAGAAPTGVASEAEYFEIGPDRACVPGDVGEPARRRAARRSRCDRRHRAAGRHAWPMTSGVRVAGDAAGDAGARRWPPRAGCSWPTGRVEVERSTAKGIRRVDARAGVITLELDRRAVDSSNRWMCHTSNGCSAHDTCCST